MRKVGGPESDGAIGVTKVNDGVVCVLGHGTRCSQLCAVLDKQLPGGCILILEVASITLDTSAIERRIV